MFCFTSVVGYQFIKTVYKPGSRAGMARIGMATNKANKPKTRKPSHQAPIHVLLLGERFSLKQKATHDYTIIKGNLGVTKQMK